MVQNGVFDLAQSIAKASRGFQLGIPEFRKEICLTVYIYESLNVKSIVSVCMF